MCIIVSHFRWNQKQTGDPNSFAADWDLLSDPPPHSISSSLPGCLDRLFICPAWARKGYCDSKRRLMQKHCPSSCDFCYGKTQRQQKAAAVQGEKKKVFSQLSSTGSCCEPFANGATGANESSHAELWWGFSRISFEGRLHLPLGEFLRITVSGILTGQSRYLLISVFTPSIDNKVWDPQAV